MENYSISELYKVVSRDSGGSQNKYYRDGIWYKQDTAGEESVAEYIASLVLKHSNMDKYVTYDMCEINGRRSCKSIDFLEKGESFISLHKLYMAAYHKVLAEDVFCLGNVEDRFHFIVNVIKNTTCLDLTEYFSNIFTLDMLLLNPDRHFKNMGIIYNGQEYRKAPLFDHGQSLGANWNLCPPDLSVQECLDKIQSCSIAGSFEMQFSAVKHTHTLSIDYDSLMGDLAVAQINSRVIEILKYQLERYKKIFKKR
ncbi:MAG: hypothetical protein K2P76_04845 [Lachnospiraceae bacterium]|nr:hypothetical protein [Lachnospiraceae bacterium]MDE6981904.1 hypothetical protein [Lachnospiraceae bacterium]